MLNMRIKLHLIPSGKKYKNFKTHELLSTRSQLTCYFCPIVQLVFFFFLRHFNVIVLFYLCNFGLVLTACSHYFYLAHISLFLSHNFNSGVILFPPKLHSLEISLVMPLVVYAVHIVVLENLKIYFFHSLSLSFL